jgi:hypothetical protein
LGLNIEEEFLQPNFNSIPIDNPKRKKSERKNLLKNGTWEKMNIRSAAVIERKI